MKQAITQGMVLAAGRGERMRPLTDHIPKPMIEIAGQSMVDRALDRLSEAGVERAVVNISYKAEMLEEHLSGRKTPHIIFSREEKALETGGGVAQALQHFSDSPFFVVNGDIIWVDGQHPALWRLQDAWSDAWDALLLLHPLELAVGYEGKGDFFFTGREGLIRRGDNPKAPYVFAGVQILHPRLFVNAPKGTFSLNIFYDRLLAQKPQRIHALVHDGQWLHVGDIAGKEKAEAALKR